MFLVKLFVTKLVVLCFFIGGTIQASSPYGANNAHISPGFSGSVTFDKPTVEEPESIDETKNDGPATDEFLDMNTNEQNLTAEIGKLKIELEEARMSRSNNSPSPGFNAGFMSIINPQGISDREKELETKIRGKLEKLTEMRSDFLKSDGDTQEMLRVIDRQIADITARKENRQTLNLSQNALDGVAVATVLGKYNRTGPLDGVRWEVSSLESDDLSKWQEKRNALINNNKETTGRPWSLY